LASCTQIDQHLQSYLDGELPLSDRAILEHHVAECSPCANLLRQHQRSNASLFEALAPARLNRDLSEYIVSHLPEIEQLPVDVQSLNRRAKHPTPMRERLFRLVPIGVAALLLVLAGLIQQRWPEPAVPTDAIGVVAAAEGMVHRVAGDTRVRSRARERVWALPGDRFETEAGALASVLTIGPTEVKLAPETQITIDGERKITLDSGRIFLDVARSQGRFKVVTPMGEVTVFGTRFDVLVAPDRTTVIVEQGEVQLSHHDNPKLFRMLKPGQRAFVETGRDDIPVETVDVAIECAWANGIDVGGSVREYFAEKIQPARETHEISGEGGYFLQTDGKPLKALIVTWAETSPFVRYDDYDVYVYAPDNTAVFRTRIAGSTFSDPRVQEIEIPNTSNAVKGYPTVYVKLVPLGGLGRDHVDFASVSGRIGKEGR